MRIGFIGGNGHHYLRRLLTEPTVKIARPVGVASDGYDPAAASKLSQTLGDVRWFDTPEMLLRDYRPDIVSVGAVYGHNGDVAAQTLERGVPTVSDKPIAATWEQLKRLTELTARTGAPLISEFPFRCLPEFRAARETIRRGLIGPVVLATAQKSYRFGTRPAWYADRAAYGGTMLWVASHGIDAIRFVTGQRLTSVFGRQGNVSKTEFGSMEDHCVALFALEGGGTGLVHADYLRPAAAATHGDDRLRVVGGGGLLEIRDERCRLTTADAPETDITASGAGQPVHLELFAALRGTKHAVYGTAASLESAALLLYARDAADAQTTFAIPNEVYTT
jgi:predicted dehydrogenase